MVNLALTWQQAGLVGGGLIIAAVALRRSGRSRAAALAPFARESALVAALYALWQLAGTAPVLDPGGAYARGRWIIHTERAWHLPSELDLQHLVLLHSLLVQACNLYYDTMHFTALFALLLWLFVRHRDRYRHVRNTVVLLTAACLLIQLVPVAPPRLLPGFGFVDTAAAYGQSVYVAMGGVGVDQLSAMPSVHVGWAVLVGVAVVTVSPSRWRWAVLLHPAATVFVVTATANHYWVDGIVAIALLVLALLAQHGARAVLARARARHAVRPPILAPAGERVTVAD